MLATSGMQVDVVGMLAPIMQTATCFGMVTRAASVRGLTPNEPGDSGVISWRERFLVTLPPALAEQLLIPAPGDNPYAGTAIELQVCFFVDSIGKGML